MGQRNGGFRRHGGEGYADHVPLGFSFEQPAGIFSVNEKADRMSVPGHAHAVPFVIAQRVGYDAQILSIGREDPNATELFDLKSHVEIADQSGHSMGKTCGIASPDFVCDLQDAVAEGNLAF